MLMSKSRLEKFLYALYSLDSSDLPTPLSRIEELYKCLVTGEEAPTFEPISRVEKYLMAILGVYDVNELPNPISRVEVLLHKLAISDDNLDDIKSFLSEHEELLAEIIRNGGVGGNIDIEYVLYTLSTEFNTLYNTAEKPVKSAILKGNTLVNIVKKQEKPFFDGMKSVQMPVLRTTGKNLLSLDDVKSNSFNGNTVTKIDNGFNIKTTTTSTGWNQNVYMRIKVEPNTTYVYSVLKNVITDPYANMSGITWGSGYAFIKGTQTNHTLVEGITANNSRTNLNFNTGVNKEIIIYHCALADTTTQIGEFELIDFQLEENSTGTSYEPHKSNILTVKEDITLRGVGDVKDELNLITGELTQRISETIIIDETVSDISIHQPANSDLLVFRLNKIGNDGLNPVIANNLTSDITPGLINYPYGVRIAPYGDAARLFICLPKSVLSEESKNGLIEWLSLNPVTIQYTLATESIKTVDLSVVDQDGNNTELKTFDDITHVTLSSEALIPEAELEVATKNEEVLNTMSLEMDDIFTTQTTLGEIVNTQSENTDATMIATTEIYEGLL